MFSWDMHVWGGGVGWGAIAGCDISSLTPPNTGASVVCGRSEFLFHDKITFL